MKKSHRETVRALDNFCVGVGVPKGVFKPGKKHGRYTVTLSSGASVYASLSNTPADIDSEIRCAKTRLARLLRANGVIS